MEVSCCRRVGPGLMFEQMSGLKASAAAARRPWSTPISADRLGHAVRAASDASAAASAARRSCGAAAGGKGRGRRVGVGGGGGGGSSARRGRGRGRGQGRRGRRGRRRRRLQCVPSRRWRPAVISARLRPQADDGGLVRSDGAFRCRLNKASVFTAGDA